MTTIETLTAQYLRALHKYENSRLGPKTDEAEARMERILNRAEKHGMIDQLIDNVSAARGH